MAVVKDDFLPEEDPHRSQSAIFGFPKLSTVALFAYDADTLYACGAGELGCHRDGVVLHAAGPADMVVTNVNMVPLVYGRDRSPARCLSSSNWPADPLPFCERPDEGSGERFGGHILPPVVRCDGVQYPQ